MPLPTSIQTSPTLRIPTAQQLDTVGHETEAIAPAGRPVAGVVVSEAPPVSCSTVVVAARPLGNDVTTHVAASAHATVLRGPSPSGACRSVQVAPPSRVASTKPGVEVGEPSGDWRNPVTTHASAVGHAMVPGTSSAGSAAEVHVAPASVVRAAITVPSWVVGSEMTARHAVAEVHASWATPRVEVSALGPARWVQVPPPSVVSRNAGVPASVTPSSAQVVASTHTSRDTSWRSTPSALVDQVAPPSRVTCTSLSPPAAPGGWSVA